MDAFTEAEIQVLIVLIELARPVETPNNNFYHFYPKTIEEAAAYFKCFRVDWTGAYQTLEARGFIRQNAAGWELTGLGLAAAEYVRADRPPIWYWYQEYYTLTARSKVYADFCERLYGRNLCQANFSDMHQIHKLAHVLSLGPGQRVLDIGCGKGMIAEYISDETGAAFLGIDYSPEAIRQAQDRTGSKRDRLEFRVMSMDRLELPKGSFDAVISIDTLYMPADLHATLLKLASLLKPGGQMGIFYQHMLWDPKESRESLLPDFTPLGIALAEADLAYCTRDYSAPTYRLLQAKRRMAEKLRPAFESEGTMPLYENILMESESSAEPYDPDRVTLARYLYHVCL